MPWPFTSCTPPPRPSASGSPGRSSWRGWSSSGSSGGSSGLRQSITPRSLSSSGRRGGVPGSSSGSPRVSGGAWDRRSPPSCSLPSLLPSPPPIRNAASSGGKSRPSGSSLSSMGRPPWRSVEDGLGPRRPGQRSSNKCATSPGLWPRRSSPGLAPPGGRRSAWPTSPRQPSSSCLLSRPSRLFWKLGTGAIVLFAASLLARARWGSS